MVPAAACDPDSASSLGDAPAVGKMWEAAVHTGQVMAQAVDDPNYGMNALCSENVKGIFYSSFDLSKEQSCGEYRVDATAVSTGGGTSPTLSNYIDVECVTYLKIDFSSVNWGTITPNVKGQVTGNLLWEPANSIHPTVMNVGNDGMGIGVIFSADGGSYATQDHQQFRRLLRQGGGCYLGVHRQHSSLHPGEHTHAFRCGRDRAVHGAQPGVPGEPGSLRRPIGQARPVGTPGEHGTTPPA